MNTIHSLAVNCTHAKTNLCEIGGNLGTDKSPWNKNGMTLMQHKGSRHPYTAIYELLFAPYKNKPIRLVEIGILYGASLQMWRQYFSEAEIFGYDYDLNMVYHNIGLNLPKTIIDQMDVRDALSIRQKLGQYGSPYFHIIIDDATHEPDDQIRVIRNAVPHLYSGGIMIVEDIALMMDENLYKEQLKDILYQFSFSTFIFADHVNRNNDHDKLLVMVKN